MAKLKTVSFSLNVVPLCAMMWLSIIKISIVRNIFSSKEQKHWRERETFSITTSHFRGSKNSVPATQISLFLVL